MAMTPVELARAVERAGNGASAMSPKSRSPAIT